MNSEFGIPNSEYNLCLPYNIVILAIFSARSPLKASLVSRQRQFLPPDGVLKPAFASKPKPVLHWYDSKVGA
jgi:hypothetical protein